MSKKRLIKPRSLVGMNPLLGKGGVHEKTQKAKRSQAKRELSRALAAGGREPYSAPLAA